MEWRGKATRNPYQVLGLGLILAGAVFAPIAYFLIASVALTAVGLSALMIGFTCIALANARPYISPEASETILKTGMENTAALLEELGVRNKAIYLPSSMRDGRPQALIPLTGVPDAARIRGKIPGRLVVRYGDDPGDMALAVTTPGSINLDKLEAKPGPTAEDIQHAVTYVLTGLLDLANAVSVNLTDGAVDVEVTGPRLRYEDIWYYRCLGSPVASIVATIACEALDRPLRIASEEYKRGKSLIRLEKLS